MSQISETSASSPTENGLRRVKNTGNARFIDFYDGAEYLVEPGGEIVVPAVATDLWFGNPTFVNRPPYKMERQAEYQRLLVRYGCHVPPPEGPGEDRSMFPQVEVANLNGDRVYTVLDDPKGERVHLAAQTVSDHQALLDQIKQQSDDIERMKDLYKDLMRRDAALADGFATEDAPPTGASPSKRAQTRGKSTVSDISEALT